MLRIHPDLLRFGDTAAIQAAEALVKAITTPEWPEVKLRRNDRMTRDTIEALRQNVHIPEVKDFLIFLDETDYRTPSQIWHYFKYKYQYKDSLLKPTDLDVRFDQVLNDSRARVYWRGNRYLVYSPQEDRLLFVNESGQRITVYRPDADFIQRLGDAQWPIETLLSWTATKN
jgi:hypothetical protein